MKLEDLDLAELLDRPVGGGPMWLAGQRTLMLDATALGLLRKELIELIGRTAAQGLLTRLGYAHGWRTAESLQTAFDWSDHSEWQEAGGRLHGLQGLVDFSPVPDDRRRHSDSLAEAIWRRSYEAEQHVLHLGQHDGPVCWTLCGFASGYLSRAHGQRIYCVEERCAGQGDALCWMVGRSEDAWGDELDAIAPLYEDICLQDTLRSVAEALKKQRAPRPPSAERPDGVIARSDGMRQLCDLARRAARVDVPVLITGESGTGKERIAQLVHDASPRAGGPFVVINCAAIPHHLLEGELFGHAAGAFTGASEERIGRFEAANRGTLFLDEIGEISMEMQVKLLRVLQDHRVRRLGENEHRPVDVRIISATNRPLPEAIEQGVFRQDLYYRLRVVELQLPALRDRLEDVLPLARHFLHH
ncbi:MAG: sigma 54-interacting transcriptional regulator, partial [Myxococcota bacterium]